MLIRTCKIDTSGRICLNEYILNHFCMLNPEGDYFARFAIVNDKLCMVNYGSRVTKVGYQDRIVIPKKFRKQLGIESQDIIDIVLDKDVLVFRQRKSVADNVCFRIEKELLETTDRTIVNDVIRIVRRELQVS